MTQRHRSVYKCAGVRYRRARKCDTPCGLPLGGIVARTQPVVLVSGASSGIGRAVAGTLAQSGFQVYGTSRKAADANPIPNVEMLDLDVTDEASVARAVS